MAFYEQFPEDFDLDDIDFDGQGCGLVFWFAGQRSGSNLCFDSSLYGMHGELENMDPPTDWAGGPNGMALDFDGSNDRVVLPNLGTLFSADVTISVWVLETNLSAVRYIFDGRAAASNGFGLRIAASSGSIRSEWDATAINQGTITAGVLQHVAVTRSGTVVKHFVNGWQVGIDGSSADDASIATAAAIGARSFSTAASVWLGSISDVRLYNRGLTDSEVWDIYSNPTGIILPRKRVLKRNAAGGAFSIAADSGSYSLTGTAATLKFGRLLSAGSGSFSATGSAAGLLFDRKLAANAGSFSVTGTAATPKFGRLLSAGSGAYSISGKSANLNFSGAQLRKYQFLLRRALWRMR